MDLTFFTPEKRYFKVLAYLWRKMFYYRHLRQYLQAWLLQYDNKRRIVRVDGGHVQFPRDLRFDVYKELLCRGVPMEHPLIQWIHASIMQDRFRKRLITHCRTLSYKIDEIDQLIAEPSKCELLRSYVAPRQAYCSQYKITVSVGGNFVEEFIEQPYYDSLFTEKSLETLRMEAYHEAKRRMLAWLPLRDMFPLPLTKDERYQFSWKHFKGVIDASDYQEHGGESHEM